MTTPAFYAPRRPNAVTVLGVAYGPGEPIPAATLTKAWSPDEIDAALQSGLLEPSDGSPPNYESGSAALERPAAGEVGRIWRDPTTGELSFDNGRFWESYGQQGVTPSGGDDTAVLQFYLDKPGDGNLALRAGAIYYISEPLVPKGDDVAIETVGAGPTAVIRLLAGSNCPMIRTDNSRTHKRHTISRVVLDGNAGQQTVAEPVIQVRSVEQAAVREVTVLSPRGAGVRVQAAGTRLESVAVFGDANAQAQGVHIDGVSGCSLTDVDALQCNVGIELWQAHRTQLVRCRAEFSKQRGIMVNQSWTVELHACAARENGRSATGFDGIWIAGTSGAPAEGIAVIGCHAYNDSSQPTGLTPGQQRYGIYLEHVDNPVLVGNVWNGRNGNLSGNVGTGSGVVALKRYDSDDAAGSFSSLSVSGNASVNGTLSGPTVSDLYSKITTAQNTANSAQSAASNAQNTANSAQSAANNAQNTANNAQNTANSAQSDADGAWSRANSAYSRADAAYSRADSAYSLASTANGKADTANGNVNYLAGRFATHTTHPPG